MAGVAQKFMLMGVQEWGQSRETKESTVSDYVRAAGFDVNPSAVVIYGGIVTDFDGPDADEAKTWLTGVLEGMPRGDFNVEIKHLEAALAKTRGES
ncbi:MAG TPA: hypothetical protein VKA31_03815 [Mariprofundaceae bacterium]|nr:hypothetical protein [Mariprofundaceae bacterium]